jgi:peptidoglycan/LPS O-acetylase OafA/YrhL
LGVQLFFVISGFVIAYSSEGRTAADFAIARSVRIYPTFVFCMTVTFIATLALGAPRFEATFEQWVANLFLAAPEFKQPYMDSAYWTLVAEVTFYAWVYALMLAGVFRRGIIMIVLIWLSLSMVNEVAVGSFAIHKIFLTNQSGFFAAGLLLYEMYRGRRDAAVQSLLGFAGACAVLQGLINAQELRSRFQVDFDNGIVAVLCLGAIVLVMLGVRIRRLPLPAGVIVAIGALTYPLYLLHQQIGYIAFERLAPLARPGILFFVIVGALVAASLATWRLVERPAQRVMKFWLVQLAGRTGLTNRIALASAQS